MRTLLLTLLVGAGTTAAVGLLTADGWPGYVVGAVLAFSLWMMLFFGTYVEKRDDAAWVAVDRYLLASVVGVLLGFAMFALGDDNAAFWAPGFIIAGVVLPATALAWPGRERS